MSRLSVIVPWAPEKRYRKLRSLKPTSAETRGISSCCRLMPHCQSFGRTPQPWRAASLTRATLSPVLPKFRLLPVMEPHVSGADCAAGFRMSQSTTLLPFVSDHVRATDVTILLPPAGSLSVYRPSLVAGDR